MPRKASAPVITPMPEINQEAVREDVEALHTLDKVVQEIGNDQLRVAQFVGERIGRRAMARMVTNLLSVTDVLDLQRFKESKQYKGYVFISPDGSRKTISTWDEFCQVVEGKSVRTIDLEIMNLRQLGEDLFDSMRSVGIGPGKMREIRQLPEDSKVELIEAAKAGDKETLVDLAEELLAKHVREKEELTQKLTDARQDYEALSRVEADTSQKLRVTKLELERNQLRTAPWDERIAPLKEEITARQCLIDEALARHLQAADAMDAWLTNELTSRPDYDPEAVVDLPPEALTVLVHLEDAVKRTAHMAATALHDLENRFGHDLAKARQYLLQPEQ